MVLILSILIIAAVLATAVIFGNLIIREIQQSRLIDQSIQAYYLAESGSERALYQTRRRQAVQTDECQSLFGTACEENNGFCASTGSEVSCITQTPGDLTPDLRGVWNVAVTNEQETTINLAVGESFQLDLFSPFRDQGTNFDSEIVAFRVTSDLTDTILFGELTNLTWLIGGSALCPLSNFVPPEPSIVKERIVLTSGDSGPITTLDPSNTGINRFCSYILRLNNLIFNQSGGALPGQFTISIHSSTADLENNKLDIPSRLIIDSEAQFGRSSQTVRVRTPIRPPISGLYDFVLFSEEQIVK